MSNECVRCLTVANDTLISSNIFDSAGVQEAWIDWTFNILKSESASISRGDSWDSQNPWTVDSFYGRRHTSFVERLFAYRILFNKINIASLKLYSQFAHYKIDSITNKMHPKGNIVNLWVKKRKKEFKGQTLLN